MNCKVGVKIDLQSATKWCDLSLGSISLWFFSMLSLCSASAHGPASSLSYHFISFCHERGICQRNRKMISAYALRRTANLKSKPTLNALNGVMTFLFSSYFYTA